MSKLNKPAPFLVSTTISNSRDDQIGDALRSVVDHVDACLLIDTGIKDRTLEVALDICGDKLQVFSLEWTNDFAGARNFALDRAEMIGATWAITVDTDERIRWKDAEKVRACLENLHLAPAAFDALMIGGSWSYQKERLFHLPHRTKHPTARWIGRTHEYFNAHPRSLMSMLDVSELPRSDETNRRKWARDLEILLEETSQKPGEARWWFYLGETQRNLGDKIEAAISYARAGALSAWDEEAAWSKYLEATCLVDLGKLEEAERACAEGLTKHAEIAELAWYAAWCCHQRKSMQQAARWARIATDIAERESVERLKPPFAAYQAHTFAGLVTPREGFRYPLGHLDGPWDILRRAMTILGRPSESEPAEKRRKEKKLERIGQVPFGSPVSAKTVELVKQVTQQVAQRATPAARDLFSTFRTQAFICAGQPPLISVGANPGWPMNPSVYRDVDGSWLCNVRVVNYHVRPDGGYDIHDPDRVIRTSNWICRFNPFEELDHNHSTRHWYLVTNVGPRLLTNDFPIAGFEDLRLFRDGTGKTLHASGTICNAEGNPCGKGMREIALLTFDDQFRIVSAKVCRSPYWSKQHQKNWTPVDHRLPGWEESEPEDRILLERPLRFIYSLEPFRVIAPDPVALDPEPDSAWPWPALDIHAPRGGSQAIHTGIINGVEGVEGAGSNCYLLLSHEVEHRAGQERIYWHRFALINKELTCVKGWTPRFSFQPHPGIEFACGLGREGDRLIASYGVRDAEAWIAEFSLKDVLSKLEPTRSVS